MTRRYEIVVQVRRMPSGLYVLYRRRNADIKKKARKSGVLVVPAQHGVAETSVAAVVCASVGIADDAVLEIVTDREKTTALLKELACGQLQLHNLGKELHPFAEMGRHTLAQARETVNRTARNRRALEVSATVQARTAVEALADAHNDRGSVLVALGQGLEAEGWACDASWGAEFLRVSAVRSLPGGWPGSAVHRVSVPHAAVGSANPGLVACLLAHFVARSQGDVRPVVFNDLVSARSGLERLLSRDPGDSLLLGELVERARAETLDVRYAPRCSTAALTVVDQVSRWDDTSALVSGTGRSGTSCRRSTTTRRSRGGPTQQHPYDQHLIIRPLARRGQRPTRFDVRARALLASVPSRSWPPRQPSWPRRPASRICGSPRVRSPRATRLVDRWLSDCTRVDVPGELLGIFGEEFP
ncbi:hypothetical protein ACFZAE_31555 [Streptomyces scabiei]|uniref:hypothetical protein n=1 Tax=Streptomyces scabiei TaxID=1930 RepID=UPI0036DFEEF5